MTDSTPATAPPQDQDQPPDTAAAWPEACQSMLDMTGWSEITCETRQEFFDWCGDRLSPFSSLTDPDGQYGRPTIYTEWGYKATEKPWLRDYRYPDENRCAHFMPKRQVGWPFKEAVNAT